MAMRLLNTLVLSTGSLLVLGRRATVDTDSDLSLDVSELDMQHMNMTGTICNQEGKELLWKRFEVGKKYGKPCSEHDIWGKQLSYEHPDDPEYISLYLYPSEDHNDAFGVCQGKTFSKEFCARILTQSDHYSVYFYRVWSVEDAKQTVKLLMDSLPGKKIKHLVLGGHGSRTSLHWGSPKDKTFANIALEVEDDVTADFLDSVFPYLMTGKGSEPVSTVFLDACLNAQVCTSTINMLNYVSIRLAGTKVYASEISWSNDQLDLQGDGADFEGTIGCSRPALNRMKAVQLDSDELRDWLFYDATFCGDKKKTEEEGVNTLDGCRASCESEPECRAFSWYKNGNGKYPEKQCYLSEDCGPYYREESRLGAWTFMRPNMPTRAPAPTPSPTPAPPPAETEKKPRGYICRPRRLRVAWKH